MESFIQELLWQDSLLPVIAQDHKTLEVLMMAWASPESLRLSVQTGYAVYWSRSRKQLWHKGERSGSRQRICQIRTDCDQDVLLFRVEQHKVACHTGRRSCFYHVLESDIWTVKEPILIQPDALYE